MSLFICLKTISEQGSNSNLTFCIFTRILFGAIQKRDLSKKLKFNLDCTGFQNSKNNLNEYFQV